MRMSKLLTVAAMGAVVLAACDRSTVRNPPTAPVAAHPGARPAAVPAGQAATAPEFVARTAASDRFEIDAGKIALARSTNTDVREFASEMIAAHAESTQELRHAIVAARLRITLPAALPTDIHGRLVDLAKVDATAFDKAYIQSQIGADRAAIVLMQSYSQTGDVDQLKRFAADTAPAIQEHLGVAREIMATLK